MKKHPVAQLMALLFVILALVSCEKGPGEGGTSSIQGYVHVTDYQNGADYPGADYDVFLIYGDDVSFSERSRTAYNGKFEFKYLREGDYTVYVYSDDLSPSETRAVIDRVSITGKKQTVTTDTLFVDKY